MTKKKQTYETAAERLSEIVEELDAPGLTLDKSLALYKEGITLAKFLKDTLRDYESEITILKSSLTGEQEEAFSPEDE